MGEFTNVLDVARIEGNLNREVEDFENLIKFFPLLESFFWKQLESGQVDDDFVSDSD